MQVQIMKNKKVTVTLILLVGLYLVTYALDSMSGGYWPKPVSGGKYTYSSGLSASTAILWQPYYGYNSPYEVTLLGRLYSPLINLDRKWWHKNKDLAEDEHEIFGKTSSLRIHPKFNPRDPDAR